jgi:hypothetical protein
VVGIIIHNGGQVRQKPKSIGGLRANIFVQIVQIQGQRGRKNFAVNILEEEKKGRTCLAFKAKLGYVSLVCVLLVL